MTQSPPPSPPAPSGGHKLLESAAAVAIGIPAGIVLLICLAVGLTRLTDNPVGTVGPYAAVAPLVGGAWLWNRHARRKEAERHAREAAQAKPFAWPTEPPKS
jgi:hypothetical protein